MKATDNVSVILLECSRRAGRLLRENSVPSSGNTRAVVGQSVAGRASRVVRSKYNGQWTMDNEAEYTG